MLRRDSRAIVVEPSALPVPALSVLFREHAPFVFRVLRRLGVRDVEADDVCQDVFVAVHRALPKFEGRSSVRTWIYTIAVRKASAYRRKASRRHEVPAEEDLVEARPLGSASELEQLQARDLLDVLLAQLDEDKRQVFVLYELEELSMREVCEVVGCPMQTGYSRLHAARRELQRAAAVQGVSG